MPRSFTLVLNSFGFIRVALARWDKTPWPHTLLCSALLSGRPPSPFLFFPPALQCKMDCSQLNYRNISASTYHRRAIFKSPKTEFLMSLYSTRTPNQPPEKTVCGTSWELFKGDGLAFFFLPCWVVVLQHSVDLYLPPKQLFIVYQSIMTYETINYLNVRCGQNNFLWLSTQHNSSYDIYHVGSHHFGWRSLLLRSCLKRGLGRERLGALICTLSGLVREVLA